MLKMFSKFWHHVKIGLGKVFVCKMRNGHFKKLFLGGKWLYETHLGYSWMVLEIEEETPKAGSNIP